MGRFVVEHDRDAYRRALSAMAPPGDALPKEPESVWQHLLRAMGAEFSEFDTDGDFAVTQWYPHLTVELLTEWEKVAGLPDDCDPISDGTTIVERRANLLRKLRIKYGQSRAFFIQLLQSLGWEDAALTEFEPARATRPRTFVELADGIHAGSAHCGDTLENPCTYPVREWYTHHAGTAILRPPESVHFWRCEIVALTAILARAGTANCHESIRRFEYSHHLTPLADYDFYGSDPRPRAGSAHCGDRLAVFLVGNDGPVKYARAGGFAYSRLRWWGEPLTECVIRRFKPAHTFAHFAYGTIQ